MDEYDFRRKWSGGVLGGQDCISEIDSRNCKVRDWSVDFSAACVNIDSSRMSVDNLSQRSNPNETGSQTNFRGHSGESAAVDSSIYTRALVDTAGSAGIKDYHAIDMWQSQAAAVDPDFFHPEPYIHDEEDSNTTSRKHCWKHEGPVNEGSVSQVTVNKIDREGYESIMKKSATKVMELATDSEKAMAVYEFLDYKRRNKMVAGRFVNAYSINDWTLRIAFRASLLSQGVGGIQPVDVPGIENVDVTQLVEGHSSYLWKTKQILEQLELNSYYPVFKTTTMTPPPEENSSVK